MIIQKPQRLPDPTVQWVDAAGRPTRPFYEYMRDLDQRLRQIIEASNAQQIAIEDQELRITNLETP